MTDRNNTDTLPPPDLWHDPETGHWKRLTKPDRPTYEPYHAADTVRRLLAEARAQEREACAKLCDPEPVEPWDPYTARNNKATMRLLAQRIRARGDSNGK